jgi:hypothetical protein
MSTQLRPESVAFLNEKEKAMTWIKRCPLLPHKIKNDAISLNRA